MYIISFGGLTVLGFALWQTNPFVPFSNPDTNFLESAGGGLAIAIWLYSGWEVIASLGGELKDRHVIGKALKVG